MRVQLYIRKWEKERGVGQGMVSVSKQIQKPSLEKGWGVRASARLLPLNRVVAAGGLLYLLRAHAGAAAAAAAVGALQLPRPATARAAARPRAACRLGLSVRRRARKGAAAAAFACCRLPWASEQLSRAAGGGEMGHMHASD